MSHAIGGMVPTNGAQSAIEATMPYVANVQIEGVADLLFHRWNAESVDAKAKASKNSKAKKSDDVESYVWRCENGHLGLPGEYLRMAIIGAAKFRQDPRSPRKSAMDLVKAAVVTLTPLADLGIQDWDYLDTRRVMVQRNGINRTRPALKAGWKAEFDIQVLLPEYIDPHFLNALIADAGRLIGLADFRPTYGRYQVTGFGVVR